MPEPTHRRGAAGQRVRVYDRATVFVPINARKIHEAAVEQIAAAVRSGRLKLGDRLPPERTLTEQLGISRPTLREAAKVLIDAGVLEVRRGPRGGMFVISEVVPSDLLSDGRDVEWAEVAEVLEARRAFEPEVAQMAARHMSPQDEVGLRRIVELQSESLDDRARYFDLEVQFHLRLAEATHNLTVVTMMRPLIMRLRAARDAATRPDMLAEEALEIHQQTLDAIVGGEPAEIDDVMDRHLGYLEQMWMAELQGAGAARLLRTPR